MSPFQYTPRNEANWNKRANQSGSNYANVIKDEFNTFGAKDGENQIRILPPTWPDAEHYGLDIWVHFNVGPEGGTVLCLSKMRHNPCPICEAQAKYESAGRENAADFKPKRRVAVWLVDKKAEKPEDNPCIWTMGWTVDRDISKACKDRESGQLYQIDHPAAGYDAFFDKTGKGDTTKYIGYAISRNPSSIDQKYVDFVAANPIPNCLIWRDYDEISMLFEGDAPPKTEEGVSTSTPPPAVYTPPPIQTSAQIAAAATGTAPPPPVQVTLPVPPAPPAPPVAAAPPPPPPAPPKPFVSDWVLNNGIAVACATCGNPLYTISPTEAMCEKAHRISFNPAPAVAPQGPPVTIAPAVAPVTVAQAPVAATSTITNISERASTMRSRFQVQPK